MTQGSPPPGEDTSCEDCMSLTLKSHSLPWCLQAGKIMGLLPPPQLGDHVAGSQDQTGVEGASPWLCKSTY